MYPKIVSGDILNFDCDLIVQQCNCVTVKSHGLAQSIKEKYPYGDIYSRRKKRSENQVKTPDTPGKTVICKPENNLSEPHIACLLAQFYPGKAGNYYSKYYKYEGLDIDDSNKNRVKWFEKALIDLEEQLKKDYTYIKDIAFPYQIGCGLAGGQWKNYISLIKEFTKRNNHLCVFIIKINKN